MLERRLFLGFPVDRLYESALLNVSPQLLALFIQNEGQYLEEVFFENQRYLGHYLKSPANLSDLELMQSHIYSLLKRLVSSYPYEKSALWLFPIIQQQADHTSNIEG